MKSIAIIYFSGYGHAHEIAALINKEILEQKIESHLIRIDESGEIKDEDWHLLDRVDTIIFGSPTYMGNVAWQFKKFADATSRRWAEGKWHNKIFAGFTNSAALTGDKESTINYMFTLSQQHGGIWVGLGLPASSLKSSTFDDTNRLGCNKGLLINVPADSSPEETFTLNKGNLKTTQLFAKRIAEITNKFQ